VYLYALLVSLPIRIGRGIYIKKTDSRMKPHYDRRLRELEEEFLDYEKIQELHNKLDELEKVLAEGRNDVFIEWERISNMVDALARDFFYINGLKDGKEFANKIFFSSR
jgi:hypothetical protein